MDVAGEGGFSSGSGVDELMRFFSGSHGILVKPLLAFVSLLCLSATASAATSVVNCSTVTSTTELNASVVCPQFNGVGLQSVEITVSGTITSTITLTNNGTSAETGSGTTSSGFNVGALAGFTFSNPVFTASFSTGPQSLSAGQTLVLAGSGSGSGSLGTNASNLGPYTGSGNFSLPIATSSGLTALIGGGNFGTSQSTSASATAVVTYTFGVPTTPTPPPVAVPTLDEWGKLIFALAVAGAGLLVLLIRRR